MLTFLVYQQTSGRCSYVYSVTFVVDWGKIAFGWYFQVIGPKQWWSNLNFGTERSFIKKETNIALTSWSFGSYHWHELQWLNWIYWIFSRRIEFRWFYEKGTFLKSLCIFWYWSQWNDNLWRSSGVSLKLLTIWGRNWENV